MTVDAALELATDLSGSWRSRAAEHDAAGSFPVADMAELRGSGLLGLLVPAELGGMGCGFHDYTRVAMILGAGSGSSALLFNMHASVTGALSAVPEELARALGAPDTLFDTRDELLRGAVAGLMYGVAISEKSAGSRLSALESTYAVEGDGYRLRGHKSTCSGAGHLDGYLVAARHVEDALARHPRISYFMIPGDAVRDVEETWDPMGMRATASNGFQLDRRVPRESLVGVEGVALLLASVMPEWLVASYAAVYVGVAQAALQAALAYLSGSIVRSPAGGEAPRRASRAESPWVRERVGRADAQTEAARLVVEEAARRVDARPGDAGTSQAVYRAKLIAGDAAFAVAASLTEACGLAATMRGSDVERLLRDARSGALMPPASDTAAHLLGCAALGVEAGNGFGMRPW